MSTETAAAADAVEAAAEAAEAAAEAAEAVADAAAAEARDDDNGDNGGEPAPAAAPTGISEHDLVVVERLTRIEDVLTGVAAALQERPTFEEVRSMTPDTGEVIDTARAVAQNVAEEVVEQHDDDEHDDEHDETEGEPAQEIEITETDAPPVQDGDGETRRTGIRW